MKTLRAKITTIPTLIIYSIYAIGFLAINTTTFAASLSSEDVTSLEIMLQEVDIQSTSPAITQSTLLAGEIPVDINGYPIIAHTLPGQDNVTTRYDATDTNYVTRNGSNQVSNRGDKGNNGYDALQSTTSAQPLRSATSINNQAGIYFDDIDDYLAISTLNYQGANSIAGLFFCTVFRSPYAGNANGNLAFMSFDSSDFFAMYLQGDGTLGFSARGSSINNLDGTNASFNDNQAHIACASFDSTLTNDTKIIGDGSTEIDIDAFGAGEAIGRNSTRYGFIGDGSEADVFDGTRNNRYYQGHIGEIIYFDNALSTQAQENTICYLSNKRNIPVSLSCDTTPPTATISFNTSSPTNGSVTATVTGSEPIEILNNNGSSSYTFNDNGEFIFIFNDASGNIGSATATVNRIDKIAPTASISYNPSTTTTSDVVATLTNASENITITNNGGSNTYTFTENGSFSFTFVDDAGNAGSAIATVNWIDNTTDTAYITYSPDAPAATSQNVIATIQGGQGPITVTNNGGSNTYTFTDNGSFSFEYSYNGGANTGTKTANVYWIDKTKPTATVTYSPSTATFGSVTASLGNASEPITITNNGGSTDYVFNSNGSFTFEYSDAAGNTGSTQAEVSWIQSTASTGIFEAGKIRDLTPYQRTTITFEKSYSSTPYVFVTPASENNNNNYPIPLVRNINTNSFQIASCLDDGDATCDTTGAPEDFFYFVVDPNEAASLAWIDVGTVSTATDGSDTPLSFNKAFANAPYLRTTPQTYQQNGNVGAVAWVDAIDTTSANLIGCVHQGAANDCTTGQPNETIAYLAIDVLNANIPGFQYGSEAIGASSWTPISFGSSYQEAAVMVTQNSDNGAQDPQYAWAKNTSSSNGEIRYCEADGANDCDTHNNETVVWFSLEGDKPPTASVTYSTLAPTTNPVTVTLTGYSEPITILNNGGSNTYTFSSNGVFTFSFRDDTNNYNSVTAEVTWIGGNTNTGEIFYQTDTFHESTNNDGSLQNSITLSLIGDTFSTDVSNYVSISNIPTGLTTQVQRIDSTHVSITLNGQASSHSNTDDVSNVTISFANGAFDNLYASNINNAYRNNIVIDFYDPNTLILSSTKDTCLDAYGGFEDYNYGTTDYGWLGNNGGNSAAILMQFDLSSLPSNALINSADLKLSNVGTTAATFSIRQLINNPWIEGTTNATTANIGEPTYNQRAYGTPGTSWNGGGPGLIAGSDYGTAELSTNPSLAASETKSFALNAQGLTTLYERRNTASSNQGFALVDGSAWTEVGTKEQSDPALRPELIISYTIDDIAPTAYVSYNPDQSSYVSGDVTATLTGFSEPVTITNNGGSTEYIFSGDGIFVFSFEDTAGNIGYATATVDRMIPKVLEIYGFTGRNIGNRTTAGFSQKIETQAPGYFQIQDRIGSDNGRYTTVEISHMSGDTHKINQDNIRFRGNSIETVEGDTNPLIQFAPGANGYQYAHFPITYIERPAGTNNGRIGTYADQPWIEIEIPDHQAVDEYHATITYTIYEN